MPRPPRPLIGLSPGAPDNLQADSGSYIRRVAPEDARVLWPYRGIAFWWFAYVILFVVVALILSTPVPLNWMIENLVSGAEDPERFLKIVLVIVAEVTIMPTGLAVAFFRGRIVEMLIKRAILSREGTPKDPRNRTDQIYPVLTIEDAETFEKLKLFGRESGVLRVEPGGLYFGFGEATAFLCEGDFEMKLIRRRMDWAVELRASFGEHDWRIAKMAPGIIQALASIPKERKIYMDAAKNSFKSTVEPFGAMSQLKASVLYHYLDRAIRTGATRGAPPPLPDRG